MSPGEPLVLLPGMGCSDRLWAGVRRLLPGVKCLDAPLDWADLDETVDALLGKLPDRFALAGLSLGGIVAMALVRRAPERVSRLCLSSTNPGAPTSAQRSAWASQLADLARGKTARELQQDLVEVLLHPDAPPTVREETLAMADEVGEGRLARQLRLQGTRVNERPGLRRVRVPTLILAAADDALCPVQWHRDMHELVPGSRLRVLPGVGHLSPLEQPRTVAGELRSWLGSNDEVSAAVAR